MKHIAAYLMLLVGGNAAPTADDIKKVLSAGGVEADDEALTRLMAAVEGKVRSNCVIKIVFLIFMVSIGFIAHKARVCFAGFAAAEIDLRGCFLCLFNMIQLLKYTAFSFYRPSMTLLSS